MSHSDKNGLAVLLRAFLLLFGWFSIVTPIQINGWDSSLHLFFTFSYQSSLAAIVLSLIYFGFGFRTRITGSTNIPRILQIARFATAVAVTISFLYYCFATISTGASFIPYTLGLLMQYFVVPILFLADFFLFDRGTPMRRIDTLWSMSLLLITFSSILIRILLRHLSHTYILYKEEAVELFFFSNMDYYSRLRPDWVSWLVIFLLLSIGIGYLLRIIQLKIIKPNPKRGN